MEEQPHGIMEGRSVARTMASTEKVKLTYDDFLLFPDDGMRHELIDGEHYVSPSPNFGHQRVLGMLFLLISNHLRGKKMGRVVFAPFDVVFTRFDVVEPDLLFVSRERAEVLTKANVQGAPDLAVEVLSPSSHRHDLVRKRDLYEREGVPEYWVVDPDAETVMVYRRRSERGGGAERFERAALLTARDGDALTTPLLPGFSATLAELFAEEE
jgi:Uma2 family endonuclease